MVTRGQLALAGTAALVVGVALPVGAPPQDATPYARELYLARWPDVDRDCQDARAELLIERSLVTPTFATPRGCRVIGGRWRDPYTGLHHTDATRLDGDHLIPLAAAHRSGASTWPPSVRRSFATHAPGLAITDRSVNRSKADRDPADWWPATGRCWYGQRWLSLKALWGLTLDVGEVRGLITMMRGCRRAE